MAKIQDNFVNKAYAKVTESAANTLTFQEIQTGLAMFEKVAWVIHRIQWFLGNVLITELLATSDRIVMALCGNNKMTSLDLADQAVYDLCSVRTYVSGTPATGYIFVNPFIRDFSNLPGGGIIIPPRPLYVGAKGDGLTSASIIEARIEFTYKQLKGDEYWELVEATRIIE